MNKYKISFIFNIIIFMMVIGASTMMFTGFRFMPGEIILESNKLGMFKFFTVDSNLFMGIISLLFAIFEIRLLKGKIDKIPRYMYILKLMATTSVALTFIVVFAYLWPLVGSLYLMILNSNLFFHLLVPVFSIITFVFFERNNKISFKYSFYGVIPVIMYGLFYLINVLIHMNNGIVSPVYDFYWFVQNGVWTSFIVVPVMFIISHIISLILWRFNRIKSNNLFFFSYFI